MRSESQNDLKTTKQQGIAIDIIQQTRKIVKPMNQKERFQKAKHHLFDALSYKSPRLDIYSLNVPKPLKFIYKLQTSGIWLKTLFIISFIYMYMIAVNLYPKTPIEKALEIIFLCIFCLDVLMEVYHKKFQVVRITSKFQTRFYLRVILICALLVDQVAFFVTNSDDMPFRPFLSLRCFLPLFYDSTARKAFEAVAATYKDIFVYVFFYSLIIISFAIVANQVIEIPQGAQYDQFTQNYGDLGKMIFIMYVLSSYDAYPDNQILAIQNSIYIYGFFILFIFLNVFFFVTIPTTILFNSFRQTHSKTILIDEIKQQHSLIMSFVSLGEDNLNISQNKLIRFLLYVYKNKVRYVDYITQVCLKLDDNNNGKIQVNQFMQICKILQSKSSMLPPMFKDWQKWLKFRNWVNGHLKFKKIVLSRNFKIFLSIFIILTFLNCSLAIYTQVEAFNIIDDIFMVVYCLQITIKLIGLGPQNYFRNAWNKLDFFLIMIGLILQLAPQQYIPNNSDILFKMTRIFRISLLINLFSQSKGMKSQVYMKSKRLISQMVIIVPIVMKFMPIYLVCYYVLGVVGIQVFQNIQGKPISDSPYNQYDQFSNFHSFFGTQFIFVQVLVQAGWSMIAYDYAYRFNGFTPIMLYFVLSHLLIVIVLSSLLKGIAWEVYAAVHEQFNDRRIKLEKVISKQNAMLKKKQQFEQIRQRIDLNQLLLPDNLITRELYENKIDIQIFKKIKSIYTKNLIGFSRQDKRLRSNLVSHIMQDRNILLNQIMDSKVDSKKKLSVDQFDQQIYSQTQSQDQNGMTISRMLESLNLQEIEDLDQQDFQQQMQKVLSKIILHHKITYFQTIAYPVAFVEFLDHKLQTPRINRQQGFNIQKDVIGNKQSINFLTYELNVLLGIQKSERQQKTLIIQNMVDQDIISEDQSVKILTKKLDEKDHSLDPRWIMRKMFLADTNETMIKKFQIQYFSSVYGRSFKEINKVTIQPLLRLQSRLTYCLTNVLRYRQIDVQEFFTILSTIQDSISNKLLKKGSLFKFVYQIDSISQNWFSIQLKQSKQLKVHFIKSGLWVYNKTMVPNSFKYGRDIFHWDFQERADPVFCQKYIKRFFQAFQTLAFSLYNQKNFFQSDPHHYIYDLFTFYKDVSQNRRFIDRKLSIQKIMLVILSKQDERQQPLSYQLTDIKRQVNQEQQIRKNMMFKIDESQNQTFKKLKRIQLMDYEKIVETQGLPFSYIINLMTEVRNILDIYENNFIYQIEKALNQQFDEIKDDK